MKLRLTLADASDLPASVTTRIDFGDRQSIRLGRLEGLEWTLPDPRRVLSGCHCEIRRLQETYLLYDLSTNGTFLEGSTTRLTSPHTLQDGERLVIGDYLIRVELTADSEQTDDDRTRIVAGTLPEPLLELTVRNKPTLAEQPALTTRLGRQGELRIGRDDSADWTLPDRTGGLSRQHCTIRFTDGAFVLQDTSSNGTFVNGNVERISDHHRLRDGDLLSIGSYLIAAQVSGLAEVATPAPTSQESDKAEYPSAQPVAPAPVLQAPARPTGGTRRGGDPAAMLADLPPAIPAPAGRDEEATPAKVPLVEDGVTRLARVLKTPPMPPENKKLAEAAGTPAAPAAPAAAPVKKGDAGVTPEPPLQTPVDDRVLAGIARGLGLSPEDLDEADAAVLGERMGELILLLTEEVRQLLALRDAALAQPAGARPGASASNPLAIMPTSEEALRVLFGPPRRAYLDSRQSFQTALSDLRQHFRQTDAAVRAATLTLANELAPEAIDKAASAESFIGQLLSSRKARLWDIYVERWAGRTPLQPGHPVSSFIHTFADATTELDRNRDA
jgi:type VI secretion system protein ImpI